MNHYFPGWEEFNGIYGQGKELQSTAHPLPHPLLRWPYLRRRKRISKDAIETIEIDLVKGRKKAVLRLGSIAHRKFVP